MRKLLIWILFLLSLPWVLAAQVDTTILKVSYPDSVRVPVYTPRDSVVTLHLIDTTYRESTFTATRDSLILTPKPSFRWASPAAAILTTTYMFADPMLGCWQRNGGTHITSTGYVWIYPVGWGQGRTPGTLQGFPKTPSCLLSGIAGGPTDVRITLTGFWFGNRTLGGYEQQATFTKVLFIKFGDDPTQQRCSLIFAVGNYAPQQQRIAPAFPANLRSECNTQLPTTDRRSSVNVLTTGTPHTVVIRLHLNTPGMSDGTATVAVDGVVSLTWTGGLWRPAGYGRGVTVTIAAPTWGGTAGIKVRVDSLAIGAIQVQ